MPIKVQHGILTEPQVLVRLAFAALLMLLIIKYVKNQVQIIVNISEILRPQILNVLRVVLQRNL